MLRTCSVKSVGNMKEFYGKKYKLVKSENFDELLIFLDINYLQRQLAMTLRPVQYVTQNEDGTYTIHFECALVKTRVVFTPGVEFDETKPDGVKVRALVTIDGNKVCHRQVEGNGRTLNHVYEFFPDKMIITTKSPGMDYVVKRYYAPVK